MQDVVIYVSIFIVIIMFFYFGGKAGYALMSESEKDEKFWMWYYLETESSGLRYRYDGKTHIDYNKWMKYRVDWLIKNDSFLKTRATVERATQKAHQEYEKNEEFYFTSMCFDVSKKPNPDQWMSYRVNYWCTKNLAVEEAKRKAQEECNYHLEGYYRYQNMPKQQFQPIIDRTYDNPIAIQTRFYEKKGYTPSEAAKKAREDMS